MIRCGRPVLDRPVRQIVAAFLQIIKETTVLDDQPPRVGRLPALIVAKWAAPGRFSDCRYGPREMGPFSRLVHVAVVEPTIAMACDLPAGLAHCRGGRWVLLMAIPTALQVTGRFRSRNSQFRRQKPARLPYS